jgi:hypothetical protein
MSGTPIEYNKNSEAGMQLWFMEDSLETRVYCLPLYEAAGATPNGLVFTIPAASHPLFLETINLG